MSDPPTIRTRFAPSPSGHLHVGGARSALFCWAYARAHVGKFILRIEDTDQKRSSDASSMAFLEDLHWLGIHWDEGPEYEDNGGGETGPYFQSQRRDIYDRYIEQLIDQDKAYRAFETPDELQAARDVAQREKRRYRYDRASLDLDDATIRRYLDEGRPHVVRFRAPDDESVSVDDEVLGEVTVGPEELDDFIIRKADGFPTYHFAVVVDDELMGVTHVLRGQEHLNNTPRHVLLQDALGFRRPVYAHLSIIFNPDNSKMSKRDKDKTLRRAVKELKLNAPPDGTISGERWSWWLGRKDHQLDMNEAVVLAETLEVKLPEINVDDFQRSGYLPEVLINYLSLLGWSPGGDVEKFDADYLVKNFEFDRLLKSPAKFDRDKLLAFNLDAIQAMDADEWTRRFRAYCETYHPVFIERLSDSQFDFLARANQDRSKTFGDPIESCRFFIMHDDQIVYEDSKSVRKAMTKGDTNGYAHLEALLPVLSGVEDWSIESLESAIKAYAEEHAGGKLGAVAQPLRIAVSGGTVSPAIFDTLAILGRDSVLARIQRCLDSRIGAA